MKARFAKAPALIWRFASAIPLPMSEVAKSATILVIDDDAEIRYSLSRVLSPRGYQVIEAPSGETGVAMVKKGPAPDLVLLDVRMSGIGGIDGMPFWPPR